MIKRIDHVELVTNDIERAIRFYTEVLGFQVRSRQKMDRPELREIAYVTLGDTMLELIHAVQPAPLSGGLRIGLRMFALEVDNMEAEIERLKNKGVEISRPPVTLGTSKRAEIKDPDGVSIELRQW